VVVDVGREISPRGGSRSFGIAGPYGGERQAGGGRGAAVEAQRGHCVPALRGRRGFRRGD
jgi:hypothetical protein